MVPLREPGSKLKRFFIFPEIGRLFAKHYGKDRPAAARNSHPPTQQHPPPGFSQSRISASRWRSLLIAVDYPAWMQMLRCGDRDPKDFPANGGILPMNGPYATNQSPDRSKYLDMNELQHHARYLQAMARAVPRMAPIGTRAERCYMFGPRRLYFRESKVDKRGKQFVRLVSPCWPSTGVPLEPVEQRAHGERQRRLANLHRPGAPLGLDGQFVAKAVWTLG